MGRVLIIEDEPMVQMLLEDICELADLPIEAMIDNVTEAIRVIDTGNFDVVILDVNLQGETSEPLAELLKAKPQVKVFVATGSHPGALPDVYGGFEVVQKPFNMGMMICALKCLSLSDC
jgi:DNA-binding NtrC family response regulator